MSSNIFHAEALFSRKETMGSCQNGEDTALPSFVVTRMCCQRGGPSRSTIPGQSDAEPGRQRAGCYGFVTSRQWMAWCMSGLVVSKTMALSAVTDQFIVPGQSILD